MDEAAVQDVGRVRGDSHAGGQEWAEDDGAGGPCRIPEEPEHCVCVGEELNFLKSFSKVNFELCRLGNIDVQEDNSPELVKSRNLIPPTEDRKLWGTEKAFLQDRLVP